MFCPVCKAEYRPGFTECADCKVALVAELPQENSREAYVVLWSGEDPVLHDSLIEELERAGLEYAETPIEKHLQKSENLFNLKLGPRFGFVISVRTSALRRARAILERLLDREPEDTSLAETEARSESPPTMDASDLPLHWDPLSATAEIWTGQSPDRLQFLASALQEVGIPSRSREDEQRDLHLLVRPEDAMQAREIVGQILEAALPEKSVVQPAQGIWYDEPVRSYLFAWLPAIVCLVAFILVDSFDSAWIDRVHWNSAFEPPLPVLSFVSWIGFLWMLYQVIRYEIHPWRFILLSFLPFSFVWYYYERYRRREGHQRLPITVRERIPPRPSA